MPEPQAATEQVRTVCSYCGVGCGIVLDVERGAGGRRAVVRASGDRAHPANGGRLCTKGATGAEMLVAPGRLTRALVRAERGAEPEPVALDEAVAEAGRRLRAVMDEHGPDAVALYVSGQLSLEAQYLANKLAKGFIRTSRIESNSRLCMASAGSGYKLSLGADGPPGSYEDFDRAEVFFVIGANMADCHPILFLRLLERRKAGAKLIVVDPRRSATADKADLFLRIRPGTDLALLNGLLHLLVENGDIDEEFIAEHTEGWADLPDFLAGFPPAKVAGITGIPEADIRRAAAWIGAAGEWMSCWTMGLNQSTHGTWNTNALVNLHLATGAICRPGSGPFSLTGQPNAMGGREMGYMGPGLPGQRSALDADDRAFTEELWGLPAGTLRAEAGQGTVELFERMAAGEVKACWIICTNPVASVANRGTVIKGLEAAELVITQDVFADTETNAFADITLPAALWAESEGVMVNSERGLTLSRQVVDPPGEALADWRIITRVAREMGFTEGFGHGSAAEVFEELKGAWNPRTGWDLRGVSHERLRRTPVQWPSSDPAGPARNPVRYLNDGVSQTPLVRPDGTRPRLAFPTPSGRAVFFARPHLPAAELPDDDYPFLLNTGRVQHQWHTLTKTGKVARLNKLNPGPFVELHPRDAAGLGVGDGDRVEVASRRGRAVLPARISDRVRPGDCFAPFHWNDLFGEYLSVNAVTSDAVDPISLQPEFKVCAVRLTKVAATGSASPGGGISGAKSAAPEPAPELVPGIDPAPASEPGPLAVLAALWGVGTAPPALADAERQYLGGFLAGLASSPPAVGTLPALPASAPLERGHAAWAGGVLAGIFSRVPAPGTASPASKPAPDPAGEPAPAPARQVVVLWASQTGNAEEAAATVHDRLARAGRAVSSRSMADTAPGDLPGGADLLVVTSTFGDGDAPDNGAAFWERLTGDQPPALRDVRYGVLALGDSSYDDFCGHGRRLDERLAELGGRRLLPRLDCEPGAHQRQAERWVEQILALLPGPGPATRQPAATAAATAAATGPSSVPLPALATGAVPAQPPSAQAPCLARLTGNRLLSLPGAAKEVRMFTFDTDGALAYETGDALGVRPLNCPELVAEWLAATALDPTAEVVLADHGTVPLGEALLRHLDITRIAPALLRRVAERGGDRELRRLLRPDNKGELAKWAWGRQAVDLVGALSPGLTAQECAGLLKGLQPRLYSISSSPLAHPGEPRITVSVLRYDGVHGRPRKGVASTYLADRAAGGEVSVFVRRSPHFRPPADPATPMVMIGAGTGVAPFLGFLEERRALGHHGRNWLFFGGQHRAGDFYYREELADFQRHGTLVRLDPAFSRDQRTKIYVQDRMREHGSKLWAWLQEGAHLYVCGDASRMARDVDRTLREIVAVHGRLAPEAAAAHVRQLTADGRYARDVY
ncbi:molybdopterin-dependent oxidoreductase [Streptomyces polygonati]|uniref:Molybdopterin-dependent oxidoreductase n=1 Tax=Streptomyces polygonati TaxID=1617087 RepID=A0ABV8HQ83_9ACTN